MSAATTKYSVEDVRKHCKEDDLWMAIDGKVYDLSKFGAMHPGGLPPLLDPTVAGKDATELFYALHRSSVLDMPKYQKLQIGVIDGNKAAAKADVNVPYAEAMGTWRKCSPYYKDSHHRVRAAVRQVFDENIKPYCKEWDDSGELPSRETDLILGKAGIFASLGVSSDTADFFEQQGITLPGGISPKDFDFFHAVVITEEMRRGCDFCYGVCDGIYGGMSIGLPPLLKFGSSEIVRDYAIPIMRGEKRICLAISEPYAGSDVAQIRTTAEPLPDGSWRVSGVKKWITGGMVADYFTTLCRTEKHGPVMLLVERDDEGGTVTTKPIKTSYSAAAGTAYVTMHNAIVPAKNVIGQVGNGFYQTMANFNFERWGMVVAGNRHARVVVEESMRWALTRKVFGKTLIQQPVIRFKIGEMVAAVEAVHSLMEDLTYQMCNMTNDEINLTLAGPIALLKYKQSRVATLVSDNACQVFGGRAITGTGMGYVVEKYQRSFKFMAILGGSEEIMTDFAIRQAMRQVKDMPARL
eukprot:TRINITY_DN930_c2_g1_i1.p1 TRINITY_DN930_c2_g1~~TRINITY_DN930_c2_g1_i1.p1  ORF type:complete len:523 (+),score=77.20 TRINITY_DN930_c2_g1_i1:71-1639(+)